MDALTAQALRPNFVTQLPHHYMPNHFVRPRSPSFADVRRCSRSAVQPLPRLAFPALRRSLSLAENRPYPVKERVGFPCLPSDTRVPIIPVTDVKIRQAKAETKPINRTDSDAPYLEVRPTGTKLWRYRYKIAGKENFFAIARIPDNRATGSARRPRRSPHVGEEGCSSSPRAAR
jgi:hypothetical protein